MSEETTTTADLPSFEALFVWRIQEGDVLMLKYNKLESADRLSRLATDLEDLVLKKTGKNVVIIIASPEFTSMCEGMVKA